MALRHAASGEPIPLRRTDDEIARFTSVALVKTAQMELIRLVLEKGKALPRHSVDGEMTLQCLEGEIAVDAHGREVALLPGEMLWLAAGEPHGVHATLDCVALLTILLR